MTATEFKARRLVIGWTQQQAATALGVTVAQISAIENGRSKVTQTIENLIRLYRPFDVPKRPQGIEEQ